MNAAAAASCGVREIEQNGGERNRGEREQRRVFWEQDGVSFSSSSFSSTREFSWGKEEEEEEKEEEEEIRVEGRRVRSSLQRRKRILISGPAILLARGSDGGQVRKIGFFSGPAYYVVALCFL